MKKGFADIAYEFDSTKSEFEDDLIDLGIDFMDLGWDQYDMSLEIKGVPDDDRLSLELQKLIYGNGFLKCYLNHNNKWETHYDLVNIIEEGWRVSYPRHSGKDKIMVEKVLKTWDRAGIEYEVKSTK